MPAIDNSEIRLDFVGLPPCDTKGARRECRAIAGGRFHNNRLNASPG